MPKSVCQIQLVRRWQSIMAIERWTMRKWESEGDAIRRCNEWRQAASQATLPRYFNLCNNFDVFISIEGDSLCTHKTLAKCNKLNCIINWIAPVLCKHFSTNTCEHHHHHHSVPYKNLIHSFGYCRTNMPFSLRWEMQMCSTHFGHVNGSIIWFIQLWWMEFLRLISGFGRDDWAF